MDVKTVLNPLNNEQREAVTASSPHALILAGAGSGKTRVLVHRIAWLVGAENASPYNILAVTFTNKAAAEMKSRTEKILGMPVTGMWIGTFHSIAHRLLRMHYNEADLPETFQILDSDDQLRVIKRIVKGLQLDEEQWQPKHIQWFINGRKDEGLRAKHIEDRGDPYLRQMISVYTAYEALCQRSGLIDFAELLLRALDIMRNHPSMLAHYQQRFRHILVDEFQDTNTIQYAWIKILTGAENNLFVVGDDDQSIYGWRGAKIENIQRLSTDFPGTSLHRLEQNYRSTSNILDAANALINNNIGRMGKKLWTDDIKGEKIQRYSAFNEVDEARFIVGRIKAWINQGNCLNQTAILYRSNAQSRVIEEALISSGVAYKVYGGLRFFDRAEIKNTLAYLRLANNRNDDASFERIVNTPTRGLGNKTLDEIRAFAKNQQQTLWLSAVSILKSNSLSGRASNALDQFLQLIKKLGEEIKDKELDEQVEVTIKLSGLIPHYEKERGEKGQARIENIEELVNAAKQFNFEHSEENTDPLSTFLTHAALEAGETQSSNASDYTQLMTLHAAKGLEFPLVFLSGLEEGTFPSRMAEDEQGRIEEERRLCYVGITRAQKQLFITHAECRRLFGKENYHQPSRFISEIPDELVSEVRITKPVSRQSFGQPSPRSNQRYPSQGNRAAQARQNQFKSARSPNHAPRGFKLGQRVSHAKFGEGVILNYEGQGDHAKVHVNFNRNGSKWLMLSHAKLNSL